MYLYLNVYLHLKVFEIVFVFEYISMYLTTMQHVYHVRSNHQCVFAPCQENNHFHMSRLRERAVLTQACVVVTPTK